MGRLTQKDDKGNWSLKNIPWGELFEGRRIGQKARWAIYEALCKLKDYEDTGLEPGKLQEMDEEYQELAKEVARLREKERWNPVEEKFPEDDNYILLSFENLPLPSIGRYETDQDGGAFIWKMMIRAVLAGDLLLMPGSRCRSGIKGRKSEGNYKISRKQVGISKVDNQLLPGAPQLFGTVLREWGGIV